jgi:4-hydroxy-tetrahydrodipicolinate synthase
MELLSRQTRGTIPISPTPFHDNGALALGDIARLIDYYAAFGVCGITILGVMGEANKLSPAETETCIETFLQGARDRLPILVGVTNPSLSTSVALSRFAMDKGAAGVMLQPMTGLLGDDAIVGYFEKFIEQTKGEVPICVQDYPQSSNVTLTVESWSRISAFDPVIMLKHEPPAGLQKLSRIRNAEHDGKASRVSILTSNNAMHLPQELVRGADGAMVGVAYTDAIVQTCELYWKNEIDLAFDLYDALLPIVRHESQGSFGLAIRKEILHRRGALTNTKVRYPGAVLEKRDLDELSVLMARFERRANELKISLKMLDGMEQQRLA